MLHILLLILKIIGIILLVVLGLIILLVSTVLFVPVRYRIKAETNDGMKNLTLHAKATWILHLAAAKFVYDKGKKDWLVRVAWKKWSAGDKKKEKKHTKAVADKTEEAISDASKEDKTEEKKQHWFDKLKCTIKKIYDKIKTLWETKDKVIDFLVDESHIGAFVIFRDELFQLVKRLHPRKMEGYIRIGMEDPYQTGQILALLSILYPFYGEHLRVVPDFERKILEGNLYMKGHIRLIHILVPACKLYLDNNVKTTYKHYKAF